MCFSHPFPICSIAFLYSPDSLSCLVDIRNLHSVIEHFTRGSLLFDSGCNDPFKLVKRARPLIRRGTVRHQRIVNIKNNASISLLAKAVQMIA